MYYTLLKILVKVHKHLLKYDRMKKKLNEIIEYDITNEEPTRFKKKKLEFKLLTKFETH